jgi:signal transduction histidine kinase
MVGHDLRNPLQSIENAAYFLNQELPKYNVPPKTVEMLHTINSSIDYADKIIRDLQDFSATKPPALEKTDINTIVKETLSQIQIRKNIELHTGLAYLPEMKADKDQMKRVFLNLTQNAIQAMEHGGKLTVSTKKTKAFVEVSFKDTGVGIPKENMKKLFTPLYTTKAKGMGMGLPICKKFIENHGGSIEVESQEGKGSTFTIKLPITPRNGGEKR